MHSSTHFVSAPSNQQATSSDNFINRYSQRFQIQLDKDWSIRECKLHILQMFLDGSIYDNLQDFSQEYQGKNGAYIPLSKRRPSSTYRLCEIVVNESVGMLFGEGHFPEIRCEKEYENTEKFLRYITDSCHLKRTMLNAAKEGSIGSVCILVKVLEGKFYFDVLNTKHLTPVFDQQAPDKLIMLMDKKKTDGATLIAHGYDIPETDKNKYFYVEREWTPTEEIYYIPYLCDEPRRIIAPNVNIGIVKAKDNERSTVHDLGFVPAIWIQNLPKAHHIDGLCTFQAILDTQTEIDYQISQAGRLLKYNSDPTLVIKNPTAIDGNQLIRSQTVLNIDEKGDAYYAEMSGQGVQAVMDYVKMLREFGLESVRGNRTSPEKVGAHQSGRAMQMLNNHLINLVDEMRLTYGDSGLIPIYQMCVDIFNSNAYEMKYDDHRPDKELPEGEIKLGWQNWYPQTGQDKYNEAQAIQIYRSTGVMSAETAVDYIATEYGIEDTEKEVQAIDKETTKMQNVMNKEEAKVEPKPKKPSGT
jgi:hypothetical protein